MLLQPLEQQQKKPCPEAYHLLRGDPERNRMDYQLKPSLGQQQHSPQNGSLLSSKIFKASARWNHSLLRVMSISLVCQPRDANSGLIYKSDCRKVLITAPRASQIPTDLCWWPLAVYDLPMSGEPSQYLTINNKTIPLFQNYLSMQKILSILYNLKK